MKEKDTDSEYIKRQCRATLKIHKIGTKFPIYVTKNTKGKNDIQKAENRYKVR